MRTIIAGSRTFTWDGKSPGTRHMLEAARKAEIKLVRIVKY